MQFDVCDNLSGGVGAVMVVEWGCVCAVMVVEWGVWSVGAVMVVEQVCGGSDGCGVGV